MPGIAGFTAKIMYPYPFIHQPVFIEALSVPVDGLDTEGKR